MKKFDKVLQEQIEALPQTGRASQVTQAAWHVHEIESDLETAKSELGDAVEELNTHFALELRTRMPKLQVNLANGKCQIRFRSQMNSKSIVVFPNPRKGVWEVEPGEFSRGFSKLFADSLPLKDDLEAIVEAIIEYFSGHYKSLR